MRSLCFLGAIVICALLGCSGRDRWYEQGQPPETQWEKAGLSFVEHFVRGDFAAAHRMLGTELQKSLTTEDLRIARGRLVSEQFVALEEPWVLSSIERWPDKLSSDIGMAYVHIGGDGNEAITVTIAREAGELRVRDIIWGRP